MLFPTLQGGVGSCSQIIVKGHVTYYARIYHGSGAPSQWGASGNTSYFEYTIDVANESASFTRDSDSMSGTFGILSYYQSTNIFLSGSYAQVVIDSIEFQ